MTAEEIVQNYQIKLMKIIFKEIDSLMTKKENADENPLIKACSKIIKNIDIPVILGGGVTTQNQINELLKKTDIEFFSMQRPFVYDPSFLVDWQIEGNGISGCRTCNNCYWKKTSTCHINRPPTLNIH